MSFIIPMDETKKEIFGEVNVEAIEITGGCKCRCVACNRCSCMVPDPDNSEFKSEEVWAA
ncbi:hypothetical protein [Petroclostridium sp. X23]|uniref:hypothetical protein n=1 Tax=Petroclostridium sp. X23 TaxID=3045146 RepID=UPI0024AE0139|nr:hypothetical protein [Petroclostridium sp. X23]WHH59485.1 hypothetical protein QKW49_01575 [Petroclostridium sp. X23]